MTVKIQSAMVQLRSTVGTQDITIPGFGTPKAAMFLYTNADEANTVVGVRGLLSVGFTDGTRQEAMGVVERDANTNADTGRAHRTDAVVVFPGYSTSALGYYAFDSWITDGVRIDATDPLFERSCIVVLFGGSDINSAYVNHKAMNGSSTVTITDPGFEPDVGFFTSIGNAAAPNINGVAGIFSFGMAHDTGSGIEQGGALWGSTDFAGTTDNVAHLANDAVCGQAYSGSLAWKAAYEAASGGFALNPTADTGDDYVAYLVLEFNNTPSIKLFDFSWPTTGDIDQDDIGFEPGAGFLVSQVGVTARNTTTTANVYSNSIIALDPQGSWSATYSSQDAVSTTVAKSFTGNSVQIIEEDGTALAVKARQAMFKSDGWDIPIDTNPSSAILGFGLAIEANSGVDTLHALATEGESFPFYENVNPPAIRHGDYTTIVFQGPQTKAYAVQYDHTTGTVSPAYLVSSLDPDGDTDDHGGPAIAIDSSGYLYVFHGTHNDPTPWAKSDSANDITAWTDQTTVPSGDISYPHAVWVGSTLYLFFRIGAASGPQPLGYMTWNGSAWSSVTTLYDPGGSRWIYPTQIYVSGDYIYVSGQVREVTTLSSQHSPFIIRMDTASSDALESVWGDSLTTPLTSGEFTTYARIEDLGSGSTTRARSTRFDFDESGDIYAVYTALIGGVPKVRFADGSSGSAWSLTTIDDAFLINDTVEIIVNSSTDIDIFLRSDTADISRWNSSGGWTEDEVLTLTNRARYMRRIENPHDNLRLIICEEDNDDYDNPDLKIWGWGDSGYTLVDGSQVGGATTLVAADLTHSHTIDAVALTQAHTLVGDDLTIGHSLDAGVLTQGYSLTGQALDQSQTIDNAVLTQAHVLVAADLLHSHTIDSGALTVGGALAGADLSQTQALDLGALTQHNVLSGQDLSQGQTIDNAVLVVAGALNADPLTQSQIIEAAALVQNYVLAGQDLTQSQEIDSGVLSTGIDLTAQDLTHAQTIDAGALTQYHVLTADSLTQAQILQAATLGGVVIGELEGEIVIYAAIGGDVYTFPALSGTVH